MKIAKIITLMLLMCVFSSLVFAQVGDLPITKTKYQLRTISGGLCTDLPEDQGSPSTLDSQGRVWCVGRSDIVDDLTSCVVQFYNSAGDKIHEVVIEPGKTTDPAPFETAMWQRYGCYEVSYTCGLFESIGCGIYGDYAKCQADEMLRVRECSNNAPASVETERCIKMPVCYTEGDKCYFKIGEWGTCSDGIQKRTITEADCKTWTDKQSCSTYSEQQATKTPQGEEPSDYDWSSTVAQNLVATGWTVYYDPSESAIIGKVKIKNEGSDMIDTHLLEMQVVPKGSQPLSVFISTQETCDPNYPTNVHKNFKIGSGETAEIELRVSDEFLDTNQVYDIYFLTRHKCFKDLSEDELQHQSEYQQMPPFENYKKYTNSISICKTFFGIGCGDDGDNNDEGTEENSSTKMIVIGTILMVLGIIAAMVNPYALGLSVIGLIMIIVAVI